MTKEATGADFKSATENESKKLFIETSAQTYDVIERRNSWNAGTTVAL